jgi:nucleotide-binding universal stress UspA family protein
MYKNILVYLDDPKAAETTIGQVEELANHFESHVILTQVVVPDATEVNRWAGAFIDEAPALDAESMLVRWRAKLAEHGVGAHVSVLPGYDSVAETIVAHARAHRIDLIVMPKQLNTEKLGWSAEGVTEAVMRSAPCDVLVAREQDLFEW